MAVPCSQIQEIEDVQEIKVDDWRPETVTVSKEKEILEEYNDTVDVIALLQKKRESICEINQTYETCDGSTDQGPFV